MRELRQRKDERRKISDRDTRNERPEMTLPHRPLGTSCAQLAIVIWKEKSAHSRDRHRTPHAPPKTSETRRAQRQRAHTFYNISPLERNAAASPDRRSHGRAARCANTRLLSRAGGVTAIHPNRRWLIAILGSVHLLTTHGDRRAHQSGLRRRHMCATRRRQLLTGTGQSSRRRNRA